MRFSSLVQEEPVDMVQTLEAIAVQRNDPFCRHLEDTIMKYMELVNQGKTATQIDADQELKQEFQRIVFDRFGVTIVLINDRLGAACIPNVYTEHNALVRGRLEEMLKKHGVDMGLAELRARPANGVLGTVDTAKVKLTGWLSEQPVPVFMNWNELMGSYRTTLLELAAIFMHEMGHIFNCAAKVATVARSNQIINEAAQRVQKMEQYGETKMIYKEFEELDPTLSKEVIDGLQSGNGVVLGISAFRATLHTVRSMSGSQLYDDTSNESQADAFAAAFGYAEPLATALDRMHNAPSRVMMKVVNRALTMLMVYLFVTNLFTFFSLLGKGRLMKIATMSLISLISQILTTGRIVNSMRFSRKDYEYDDDKDRIRRIKHALVEQLKDRRIPKGARMSLVEQITLLGDIESRQETLPMGVKKAIAFISNTDRHAINSVDTQQNIERMISNDLFAASSKLELKA